MATDLLIPDAAEFATSQLSHLQTAIQAMFSDGELTMFLFHYLDYDLASERAPTANWSKVCFDLVLHLQKTGKISKMIEMLRRHAPNERRVAELLEDLEEEDARNALVEVPDPFLHWPPAAPPSVLFVLEMGRWIYRVRFHEQDREPLVSSFQASMPTNSVGIDDDSLTDALMRLSRDGYKIHDFWEVGSQLFDKLMPDEIFGRYEALRGQGALQIRLQLDDGVLQELPWETLYDSRNEIALVNGPESTLVRHARVPRANPPKPLKPQAPIKVFCGVETALLPLLQTDLDAAHRILRTHSQKLAAAKPLPLGAPEELQNALREDSWNLVHLILKHEGPARDLHFRFEKGNLLSGKDLVALLVNQPRKPELVILQGIATERPCHGILSKLGAKLLEHGVAAVLLTTHDQNDAAESVRFASQFYKELCEPKPKNVNDLKTESGRVDEAAFRARHTADDRTLHRRFSSVLFVAPGCERLFLWDPNEVGDTNPGDPENGAALPGEVVELVRQSMSMNAYIPVIGPGVFLEEVSKNETYPSVYHLVNELAAESGYEFTREERAILGSDWDWMHRVLFHWVCLHFHQKYPSDARALQSKLQKILEDCDAHPPKQLGAFFRKWRHVPGIIWTHFDGRVNNLLFKEPRNIYRVNEVNFTPTEDDCLLLHLRGAADAHGLPVLTQVEQDLLWENFATMSDSLKKHYTGPKGRGFLFLGVHPRDSLVRHLIHKLTDNTPADWRGKSVFVVKEVRPCEEEYWRPFNIEWVTVKSYSDFLNALTLGKKK